MDYPKEELIKKASDLLKQSPKAKVHFKFTCCHCGERCTMVEENTWRDWGECHVCGKLTEVTQGGLAVFFTL